MTEAATLSVGGLTVQLGGRAVITGVALELPAGGFCALMGPNGSGKTTLLRAIHGNLDRIAGHVRVDGVEVRDLDVRARARAIAVLRQEPRLDFDFTVDEVVMMGRSPHKGLLEADHAADRDIVREALEMTDVVNLQGRIFTALSGGEKQRVLLARALAQQPRLLLLDEPTNHLDVRHQLEILSCVQKLGVTVLAALHDVNLALRFAETCVLLKDGRVHASGGIDTLNEQTMGEVFGVKAERLEGADGLAVIALSRQ